MELQEYKYSCARDTVIIKTVYEDQIPSLLRRLADAIEHDEICFYGGKLNRQEQLFALLNPEE